MTQLALLAHLSADGRRPVEQLARHPRLPLVAGTARESRVVRIWDCDGGRLRELTPVDLGLAPELDPADRWRANVPPPLAWHPEQPLLVVADGSTLTRWTPDGPSAPEQVTAVYHHLAFSPDGRALWAKPSGDTSDVLDLANGATAKGPYWDTGVGAHPSGELLVTLVSDQSATFCLFARPGGTDGGMRVQRHALILHVDGYDTPLFSADGRHLAVRGNAYVESLDVFAFPSLRNILTTTLAEDPSEAWPHHNLAWDARPGVLWIGTPTGSLLELDVEARKSTEHPHPDGVPVSALAATASGELLVARANGELALLSVHPVGAAPAPNDDVAVFLAGTEEASPEGELEDNLVFTDGTAGWDTESLDVVTEAAPAAPMRL
ncbi:hypothetical protein [Kitasatospora sp. NPDC048407]|uniref:hypothetical protein n=1 Tax=Kitasatospora sp. NPDC048407 TaxID=3364051 RepID=UPI0037161545